MSSIPANVAARNGAEHTFKYPAEPQSVRLIREMADTVIRSWALERLLPDVKLILSELATNAVAETPGKGIALLMKHEGSSVSVGIWDSSTRMPNERRCALEAESGRGMTIVAKTADAHGSHRATDRNCRIGKIVWARIVL
ncbi:ATP-binding protein [Actinomadura sp. HBU206391]|uniref:ATP-binding protein n=1 Tax=Actinomadura sp. HBU206391 TaxID=2731692 RepID=UPI00164FC5DD|nr:ATP-binding protein [Actinomadura sp. HBU206391]MBC6458752.1 ATP-binding protein [Actinomadura sp. HBU206391]